MAATSDELVEAFRGLPSDWPEGTEFLVAEVFDSGDDERGWDVVAYPMDRHGTQVGGVAQVIARGVVLSPVYEERRQEAAAEWLAGRWRKAIDAAPLPVFVAPHDHWQSFDVMSGQWIDDSALYTG